jgi:hypothetical protein
MIQGTGSFAGKFTRKGPPGNFAKVMEICLSPAKNYRLFLTMQFFRMIIVFLVEPLLSKKRFINIHFFLHRVMKKN